VVSQTEFLERRGNEKNSAQPCFPVPAILSRRLCSKGIGTEKLRLFNFAQFNLKTDKGDRNEGEAGDPLRQRQIKIAAAF